MDIFAFEAGKYVGFGFALLYAARRIKHEHIFEWYLTQRIEEVFRTLAFIAIAIGIALYSAVIYVPNDSFLTWVLLSLALYMLRVACYHIYVWRRLKKLHANIIVE